MGNELIPKDVGGELAQSTSFSDITASETSFLPRIQLFGTKSNAVGEGKIEANHYGIPTDDHVIDLGKTVDAILLTWRPKALHTGEDPILECFDPESDLFKRIKDESGVKDSGAMYGPEFLLWIPSVEKYVTFFMSSKTARREARTMEDLLRCGVTLSSKIIKAGKYVWPGPVVVECSTPMEVPNMDELKRKVHDFENPPEQKIEMDDEEERG